jgi:hypothetical protein
LLSHPFGTKRRKDGARRFVLWTLWEELLQVLRLRRCAPSLRMTVLEREACFPTLRAVGLREEWGTRPSVVGMR